jgi:hypothetical protein
MNKNFKRAAYTNFIMSGIFFLSGESMASIPMIIFLVLSGMFFLSAIKDNKTTLIILAILHLFISPISSIFVFVGIGKMKQQEELIQDDIVVKPVIDKEKQRIDLMLKLGAFMVIMAGLIFATSNWEFLDNIFKSFGLLLFAMLFLGLSKFSETKLKIDSTTNMYWYLSIAFTLFAVLSLFYFEIFGEYLSFSGEGKRIVYGLYLSVLALLAVLSKKKFNRPKDEIVSYFAMFFAIDNFLIHFLKFDIRILILSIAIAILYYFKKESKQLKFVLEFLMTILIPLVFLNNVILNTNVVFTNMLDIGAKGNIFFYLFISLFVITNIIYAVLNNDNDAISLFSSIIIGAIINSIVSGFDQALYINNIFLLLIMASIYIFSIFVNYKFEFKKYMMIVSNVLMFIAVLFISSGDGVADTKLLAVFGAFIYLMTDIINIYYNKNNIEKSEKIAQPIKVILFIILLFLYIEPIFNIVNYTILEFTYIPLFIIFLLKKDMFSKNIYRGLVYLMFILTINYNSFVNHDLLTSIILIITSCAFFLYSYKNESKVFKLSSYIMFLIVIISQIIVGDVLNLSQFTNALLSGIIFLTLAGLFRKDKQLLSISSLALAIPINIIIGESISTGDLNIMLTRILWLYVIFIFNYFIIKNKDSKEVFSIISLSALVLLTIFNPSFFIALFIAILGLAIMMFGYYNKEYSKIFILGIVITVINIIYQLREFWNKIPFWLYLLIVGLLLIAFVTKKELDKLENKDKSIDNQP